MARSSLTITDATADALRRAKPALSYATGRALTMDGCVAYLLDHWTATHPYGEPLRQARAAEQVKRQRQGATRD